MKKVVILKRIYATLEGWEADMFEQLLGTIGVNSFDDFVKLTGASNFIFDDEDGRGSVSFDIPRGKCAVRGVKKIVIRNTWDDLIEIDLCNRSGKKIDGIEPLYAGDVEGEFYDKTRMQTYYPHMEW